MFKEICRGIMMIKDKILRDYVKIVADKNNNESALIIEGQPGSGKTRLVTQTLDDAKIKYKFLNTFSTPLSFFEFIFQNRKELIVLDDLHGIYSSAIGLSILKSILWSNNSKDRVVSYLSTQKKLGDIPSSFNFEGKIIFIVNKINAKSIDTQAVKSRCLYFEMNLNYSEFCQKLKEISKPSDRKIVNFILKKITPGIYAKNPTNLRILEHCRNIYSYCVDNNVEDWQNLCIKQIDQGLNVSDPIIDFVDKLGECKTAELSKFIADTRKVDVRTGRTVVKSYIGSNKLRKVRHGVVSLS